MTRLSVIGLGKLGAPIAATLASKGFQVIGVDVDQYKVEAINRGKAPVFEPGLAELLNSVRGRLTATQNIEEAVIGTDITFIVVPTPSEPEGGFSLRYVLSACQAIAQALPQKDEYHLIVLTSTVMPGSTGGPVLSTLEEKSGKKCESDFGLCYSPEFIALGSVIRDFLNPDFILIGESDKRAGDILEELYKNVCENNPPVARMNFINAELTKLALNTFVTTKISFANMLARICERLPGADVDVVTSALGLDSRIGSKYLKGAIGYGGPCFPRDNLALAALARQIGAPATLAESTDLFNRAEVERLAALVKGKLPSDGTVGILGLSYKPNTDVVEEAQGLLLAQKLLTEGVQVVVYDPAAMERARNSLKEAKFAKSAEECIKEADIIVITTPWEVFRSIEPLKFKQENSRKVIIDCWRLLDPRKFGKWAEYIALGRGRENISRA